MSYHAPVRILLVGLSLAVMLGSMAFAQAPAPAAKEPADAAAAKPAAKSEAGYRRLAPGVLRSIDPAAQLEETSSWHDVIELLTDDPKMEWAKRQAFRRDIWHLTFQCKPLRTIYIELPQADGRMQRKQVRYLVYCVTNNGGAMRSADNEEGFEPVDIPVRFVPKFTLECPKYNLVYLDQILPLAVEAIRQREDPNRVFYNSVDMCRELPVDKGKSVWGVATWEGIDPRVNRFSIYIQGLTNAYRWEDLPGRYTKGAPLGTGRSLTRKTLKLNYWRPGEEPFGQETEIPLGMPGTVDYEWIYR